MSLDRLKARIATCPLNARGRRQYTKAVRHEILAALAGSGLPCDEFAEKLGIPSGTLSGWQSVLKRAHAKQPRSSSFKTIAVESDARPATSITLHAPGGLVVEGLSIATAADLIAALARRV